MDPAARIPYLEKEKRYWKRQRSKARTKVKELSAEIARLKKLCDERGIKFKPIGEEETHGRQADPR